MLPVQDHMRDIFRNAMDRITNTRRIRKGLNLYLPGDNYCNSRLSEDLAGDFGHTVSQFFVEKNRIAGRLQIQNPNLFILPVRLTGRFNTSNERLNEPFLSEIRCNSRFREKGY